MANDSIDKLTKIKAEAAALLDENNLALPDDTETSRSRRIAHFWVLVVRSFLRNRGPVRASALAYTTLLALIPLLAVVISVTTSLLKSQGEEQIEGLLDKLVENVAPQLGLMSQPRVSATLQSVAHRGLAGGPAEKPGSEGTAAVALRLFSLSSLTNLESLAAKLKQPADPLSQYLSRQLSPATQGQLAQYRAGTNTALQEGLVEDLNRIIQSGPLYDPPRFARVALSPNTLSLLRQNPHGGDLVRLNRKLLQDAYPNEIGHRGPGGQQEIAQRIMEYIGNVRSGALGVSGVISLILVAILLLSNIEKTFNDIWGVARGRSWYARVVKYWAALTLGPLILILAIGLTSGPFFTTSKRLLSQLPWVGRWLAYSLTELAPFLVLIAAFALFYGLIPNTRVRWRAALAGGIVGGCLWQVNNLFNVLYVSKVITYSKIYGSFSVVPLFLIGMYFSWLIVLFGAQVAYAFQNRLAYQQERLAEGVHQRSREFVALRLMALVGERFQRGDKAPSGMEISHQLGVPSRLAGQLLQVLVGARLLYEVGSGEPAYAPARPLKQITCQDVLQALRVSQGAELLTREGPARAIVRLEFDRISQAEQLAASAATLQDLVDRLQNGDLANDQFQTKVS